MPMIYCMERDRLVCVVIAIAGFKLRVKKIISILIIIDVFLFWLHFFFLKVGRFLVNPHLGASQSTCGRGCSLRIMLHSGNTVMFSFQLSNACSLSP